MRKFANLLLAALALPASLKRKLRPRSTTLSARTLECLGLRVGKPATSSFMNVVQAATLIIRGTNSCKTRLLPIRLDLQRLTRGTTSVPQPTLVAATGISSYLFVSRFQLGPSWTCISVDVLRRCPGSLARPP